MCRAFQPLGGVVEGRRTHRLPGGHCPQIMGHTHHCVFSTLLPSNRNNGCQPEALLLSLVPPRCLATWLLARWPCPGLPARCGRELRAPRRAWTPSRTPGHCEWHAKLWSVQPVPSEELIVTKSHTPLFRGVFAEDFSLSSVSLTCWTPDLSQH